MEAVGEWRGEQITSAKEAPLACKLLLVESAQSGTASASASLSLSFSPIYLLVLSTFSSSSLAVVVRKQVKRIKANAASVSTVCCL